MKKGTLLGLVLGICICIVIPSLTIANSKQIVADLKEPNIRLYASARSGMLEDFELRTEKNIVHHFPFWKNVDHPTGTYAPRMLYQDINSDGQKELIVILTLGYGSGVLEQKVHVFHKIHTNVGQMYKEILVDNPLAIIHKNIKTKLSQETAEIKIGNTHTTVYVKKEFHTYNLLNQFPDVFFGNIVQYYADHNGLRAVISAQISPAAYIGFVTITYEFKNGMYQAKSIEFLRPNEQNKKYGFKGFGLKFG